MMTPSSVVQFEPIVVASGDISTSDHISWIKTNGLTTNKTNAGFTHLVLLNEVCVVREANP